MKENASNLIIHIPIPRSHTANVQKRELSSVKSGIFAATIFIVAGLLFLLMTEEIYNLFPYTVGAFFLVVGGFDVFRGIRTKEYKITETKLLANGIVYLLLGAVILYHRHESEYIIGALWGVLGIIKGSEALNTALHQMYMRVRFWKELLRAAIEMLLGVLLLIDAKATLKHHVFILGIEMLLVGWRILQDAKLLKKHENNTLNTLGDNLSPGSELTPKNKG